MTPSQLVQQGVIQVMEGRHCFEHLTVEENLLTGAYTRSDGGAAIQRDLELVYGYFPKLKNRSRAQAGYTSGGEQQMIAIGRALMSQPKMILLDEPSMGLAPQLVEEIFEIVARLNRDQGVTFLLAEQNTNIALRYASHGYIPRTAVWCSTATPPNCVKTPTSRNSTSASARASASIFATSNTIAGASAGSPEAKVRPHRHPRATDSSTGRCTSGNRTWR
jgi:ABC-type branched-subunit amino acid transport system ATPase component